MLEKYDPAVASEIDVDEDCIDEFTDRADRFFIGLSKAVETEWDDRQLDMLMQTVPNFERIGDYATNLVELSQRLVADNATFSDMAQRELKLIFDAVNEILTITVDAFAKGDNEAAKRIEPLEETIDDMVMILRDRHTKRLKSGACSVGSGLVFMETLTYLERASDQCSSIAVMMLARNNENILQNHYDYLREIHAGNDAAYSAEKERRRDVLMEQQSITMQRWGESRIGQTVEVLVEGFDRYAECWFGRSAADAPDVDGKIFFMAGGRKPRLGEFRKVKITDCMDCDLMGEIVG